MKKTLLILFFMVFWGFLSIVPIFAEAGDLLQDTLQSNSEEIALPDKTGDFMKENQIDISDPKGTLSVTPKMVLQYMWDGFKDKLAQPLRVLGGLLAVILLAAVIEGVGDTVQNSSTARIFGIISTLACVAMITGPISDCIQDTSNTLISGGNFMVSYVPVFSGIVAASGNISSAGSYSVIVLAVAEVFTQIAATILMPLLGLCMALAVVESIQPSISLSGMTNGIKKIATWGIGFLMTIFVGLLTIQSVFGTSADTLTIKATKFVVSSAVPVVGGAVSDAYTTIRSSLSLLKSGVGTYGIIALSLTVLPTILSVLAVQLSVFLGSIAAEVFGVKAISAFLKNISSVLSIAMSLLVCFSVMLIVSTAIIMMVGLNMA